MSLHTTEYSVCWKTLTLVTKVKINNIKKNEHMHNRNKSIRSCNLKIRILPKLCDIA